MEWLQKNAAVLSLVLVVTGILGSYIRSTDKEIAALIAEQIRQEEHFRSTDKALEDLKDDCRHVIVR